MDDQKRGDAFKRYLAHMHGVQSGVAIKMNYDPSETSPKMLRTGINSAMVEHSALARLLISKGVITEEEYFLAIERGAEEEKKSYEQWLSRHLRTTVTLA